MATNEALAIQREREELERAARDQALGERIDALEAKIDALVALLTPKDDKAEAKAKK